LGLRSIKLGAKGSQKMLQEKRSKSGLKVETNLQEAKSAASMSNMKTLYKITRDRSSAQTVSVEKLDGTTAMSA